MGGGGVIEGFENYTLTKDYARFNKFNSFSMLIRFNAPVSLLMCLLHPGMFCPVYCELCSRSPVHIHDCEPLNYVHDLRAANIKS